MLLREHYRLPAFLQNLNIRKVCCIFSSILPDKRSHGQNVLVLKGYMINKNMLRGNSTAQDFSSRFFMKKKRIYKNGVKLGFAEGFKGFFILIITVTGK